MIIMSRRKKRFPCGHKGYGHWCHRCVQVKVAWEQKKQEKNDWKDKLDKDPIDLRTLPRNVVLKARKILKDLTNRKNHREFHGKRLRYDRFVISIPVTEHYRLICRDQANLLVPEAAISHEEYI